MKTGTPLLSVLIPVYNEEKYIQELVDKVQRSPVDKELIIVDDASTDQTLKVLEEKILPRYSNIKLLKHGKNRGKGAAIRTAIEAIEGEIAIVQDGDLEYYPEEYPQLIEPIVKKQTDVVYGSRFMKVNRRLFIWHWFLSRFFGYNYEIRYLSHFIGIQALNMTANLLYNAGLTDEATCYKVIRSSVLKNIKLECTGFEFCPEITAKLRRKGYMIQEVPITYHPRTVEQGKKLNWTHGFEAIWTLIKYRFVK